jgi:hypothetical protein
MDSAVLDEMYGISRKSRFVGVLSGEEKTITIDWLGALMYSITVIFVGIGIHERGQRKGLEEAERLYASLLNMIADRTNSTLEGEENVERK